jgi:hypothetical protein
MSSELHPGHRSDQPAAALVQRLPRRDDSAGTSSCSRGCKSCAIGYGGRIAGASQLFSFHTTGHTSPYHGSSIGLSVRRGRQRRKAGRVELGVGLGLRYGDLASHAPIPTFRATAKADASSNLRWPMNLIRAASRRLACITASSRSPVIAVDLSSAAGDGATGSPSQSSSSVYAFRLAAAGTPVWSRACAGSRLRLMTVPFDRIILILGDEGTGADGFRQLAAPSGVEASSSVVALGGLGYGSAQFPNRSRASCYPFPSWSSRRG